MMEFNVKRRKIITSYFLLSFLTTVTAGCTIAVPIVTIREIVQTVKFVRRLLEITQNISKTTAKNINVSYQDLGKDLRNKNFSADTIAKMEKRYSYLSTNGQKLVISKDRTKQEATKLFALLETRANQNSTPELRDKMLHDIKDKKRTFEEKIKIVEEVLSQMNTSIKKYDDILGYMQVGNGINEIQQYIDNVDKVIAQSDVLNKEVETALNEGQKIIDGVEPRSL
jgi:hypothetical protein